MRHDISIREQADNESVLVAEVTREGGLRGDALAQARSALSTPLGD